MFGDATPDTEQQLLAEEGQWIFTMNDEKLNWQVTQTTDSVHVGILTASSHGYTRAGPPRCILGLHPRNVLQGILWGEPDHDTNFRQSVF